MPPAPSPLREEEQPQQQRHDGLQVEKNKTGASTNNNTNWCTCRGHERPVESMIGTWVFLILLPAAALAWHSTKRVSVVVGATLATPALAILQGTIGILTYRVYFGDAPLPQTPSHGVVCCVQQQQPQRDTPNDHVDQKKENNRDRLSSSSKQKEEKGGDGENDKAQVTTTPQSLRRLSGTRRRQSAPIAGLPLPSLGCECAGGHSSSCTAISTSSTTALLSHPKSAPEQAAAAAAAAAAETKTPLRLLVVGDSLAIGVGQAKSCTPILPETIAKTLSQKMGGRLVYWTCHGAPGASTGWIVREIERGGSLTKDKEDKNNKNEQPEHEENENNDENELESLPGKVDIMSNCSDTDESSSDDESSSSTSDGESTERRRRHYVRSGVYRGTNDDKDENNDGHEEDQHASTSDEHGTTTTASSSSSIPLSQWKENLAQHKKRFDHPEVLGPYDVVVVLTGSNDLKSAFFPFLLSGEDAEFRRQARERGGSYTMELRRLRNALFQKTAATTPERVIHSIVHTVEVATESVRERVEETLEYIAPGSSSRLPQSPRAAALQQQQQRLQYGHAPTTAAANGDDSSLPEQLPLLRDKDKPVGDESSVNNDEGGNDDTTTRRQQQQQHPLVVLPGMPARSLPIFSRRPLRWLAVPIVDIMDMHKRNFAKAHPGEVAFVPAPSVDDLSRYVTRTGPVWEQKQAEHTILALRDIKRQDCRRIESDMRRYYHHGEDKGGWSSSSSSSSPWSMLRKMLPQSSFWPSRRRGSSTPQHHHPPGSKLFSVDQVHPRDEGYDFWGRYIGASIADEMQKLKR